MIIKKEQELKQKQIAQSIEVNLKKEIKMEQENLNGTMGQNMKENLMTIQ